MKLMTKEILGKLKSNPRITDDNGLNKPWLKLFNPTGSGTWLISEIEDDGDTMFGLCDLGHGSPELGYVSLKELESLKLPFGLSIERDISFTPDKSLGEYADEARSNRYIIS
tara:strand:- start:4558 stop:4893 length:336 start_codon:yes stop_codon:yes gene_type:complete